MITVHKKKLTGVIIRTSDFKENAILVSILSENGLENYIVRGAKKINSKLNCISQPLKKVELIVTNDKKINTITEGIVLENYTCIKEDSTKQLTAMSILESIYYFSKHVFDPKLLYNFFLDILEYLKDTKHSFSLLNYFDIKLWYLIGIMPSFNQCVECGNHDSRYFSIKYGGNLCINCKTNSSYDEMTSNFLKITFLLKVEKLNDEFLSLMNEYKEKFDTIIKKFYLEYFDYTNFNRSLIDKLM